MIMEYFQLARVVILSCITIVSVTCTEYTIVPSATSPCPSEQETCLTLNNFTANVSNYANSNTTLIFSNGNHSLDSELKVDDSTEFIIYSNWNTWINCNGNGSLTFTNMVSVQIQNLSFFGCWDNYLSRITLLSIYNSVFDGYSSNYNAGTALYIGYSNADIINTSFTAYAGTHLYKVDDILLQGDSYKVVGGAIVSYGSDLWIYGSEFNGNTAELGGALFLEETVLSISKVCLWETRRVLFLILKPTGQEGLCLHTLTAL